MIWYKFHLGDYITHTLHLADAEDLAYRRLLDLYYMSEKPIPLDTQSVSRRIRLDLDITESVLREFFEHTENGYRNSRCDVEIAKYQHQVKINRGLGLRGGRPRKNRIEVEPEPNHNPKKIQNKNIKTISSAAPTSLRFNEFWSVWPSSRRKVAKAAVLAKWEKHNLDEVADVIIASVNDLKTSEQWVSGFEPAPMTYINQRRWEDDQTEQSAAPGRRVI